MAIWSWASHGTFAKDSETTDESWLYCYENLHAADLHLHPICLQYVKFVY